MVSGSNLCQDDWRFNGLPQSLQRNCRKLHGIYVRFEVFTAIKSWFLVMMETAQFSVTLVSYYITVKCYNPEEQIFVQ